MSEKTRELGRDLAAWPAEVLRSRWVMKRKWHSHFQTLPGDHLSPSRTCAYRDAEQLPAPGYRWRQERHCPSCSMTSATCVLLASPALYSHWRENLDPHFLNKNYLHLVCVCTCVHVSGCVYVYMYVCVICVPQLSWKWQRTTCRSWSSFFTMWVPGMEPKWSGWVAGTSGYRASSLTQAKVLVLTLKQF